MRLKKKRKAMLILSVALFLYVFSISCSAYSDMNEDKTYLYDENKKVVIIPNAFQFGRSVSLRDNENHQALNPQDLFIMDGRLYVADTGNNRILIFDNEFRFLKEITEVKSVTGDITSLSGPEGIFVTKKGKLLIADTQNQRIVRCDENGNADLFIEKPKNIAGVDADSHFSCTKVAMDSMGRVYCVVKNNNNGILLFDINGAFVGYIGAPDVKYDIFSLIWRKFATKSQIAKMKTFVPTEYNNIHIDERDFIWGTVGTQPEAPIRQLNLMGNNILKKNGAFDPQGDFVKVSDTSENNTRIVDVALGKGGVYSMLDQTRGHIFTYDSNGNLLYIFGNIGFKKSNFQIPSAIAYLNDKLLVLDSSLNKILVFNSTDYGKLLTEAISYQYDGNFSKSNELWTQVAKEDANFKYAFVGLGNTQMLDGNYKAAMESFQYAKDKDSYSTVFEISRKNKMNNLFPFIFGTIAAIILLLVLFSPVRKIIRYIRGDAL